MNYQKIYNAFIESRSSIAISDEVYYEVHHIVPKSLGGTEDITNLIKLTARDHYFAHLLLSRFAGPKMKIALTWFINGSNINKINKLIPSRQIEKIREQANLSRSDIMTGRVFTQEHKAALSESKKGKPTWNKGLTVEDTRVRVNVERSKATKRANPPTPWNKGLSGDVYISHYNKGLSPPSMVGRVWINDGTQQRKIMATEPIPDGWSRGRCDNKGDNNPMRKKTNEN